MFAHLSYELLEGVHMSTDVLYSIMLELRARDEAFIPMTMGHLAHAMFLNLIKQFDPALSAQLHDRPGGRPFTTSPLRGVPVQEGGFALQREQTCFLRVTLLDGGYLWDRLSRHFLEAGTILVDLGTTLQLTRMLTSATADPIGWVGTVEWQALSSLPPQHVITMQFASLTAFHLGNRQFELFPKPLQVWESLLRVWNAFAPDFLKIEKQGLREFLAEQVTVTHCALFTEIWHYPKYDQKGFVGTCTYQIQEEHPFDHLLTTLAAFARFAGIGYKTTMGMGQARALVDINST